MRGLLRRLGEKEQMKTHQVNSICPICSAVSLLGHTDMTGQELKYICPKCKARHYGSPEQGGNGLEYQCGKCGEFSERLDWEKIPLSDDESILGPMQSCERCTQKIADGNIAFIEIEDGGEGEKDRTGKLVFMKPDEEITKQLGESRAVYIEKSALAKRMEK